MTVTKANFNNHDGRHGGHSRVDVSTPKCFGELTSLGFDKDCDHCPQRLDCLKETNKRLAIEEARKPLLVFPCEKYCPLEGAEGECE